MGGRKAAALVAAKVKAAPRRKGKAPIAAVLEDSEDDDEDVSTAVALPIYRVGKIIRADKDVNKIQRDALFAIAKCTELFVETIARQAAEVVKKGQRKTMQYQDFTDAVEACPNQAALQFLHDELAVDAPALSRS
ncbi:histone-like transcription factor (CBF/NF-Y) and archaeal histone-domain-containing protein [Pavlovales sp. CCMP2436]|nr:histone-like transcription factor (CBF/NF-Y) and archaeal histone-domain-containing protein [Pavlovales sp. CCMP2436]